MKADGGIFDETNSHFKILAEIADGNDLKITYERLTKYHGMI